MPFRDGTGPYSQEPGAGQGLRRGSGRGRRPSGFGLGPSGECLCPKCETKIPHQRSIPCYEQKCPNCGSLMTRAR